MIKFTKKIYRSFSSYTNVQLFSIGRNKKKAGAALVITITSVNIFSEDY